MQTIISVLSALAEPTRLGAVNLLWAGGERSVADLMAKLGATQSRMSRHMSVLRAAGLVIARRDAQWVRYQRNPNLDPALSQLVDMALDLAARRRKPGRAAARPAAGNGHAAAGGNGHAGNGKLRRRNGRQTWTSGASEDAL